MALVDYSDSDSSGKGRTKTVDRNKFESRKRKRIDPATTELPPLPSSFLDLYATNSRAGTNDDPSLHGGRLRTIPHVEGNWPTHVYIEWYPSPVESKLFSALILRLSDGSSRGGKVESLLQSDLGAALPLHISLSRSIILTTDQRESFSDLLKGTLRGSGIRPFDINFKGLEWVSNYENTRWFLVVQLTKPVDDGLNRLLRISNGVAEAFEQPSLYTRQQAPSTILPLRSRGQRGRNRWSHGPSSAFQHSYRPNTSACIEDVSMCFHISIGWSLEQPSLEALERLSSMDTAFVPNTSITVNTVKAKIGNSVTSVPLTPKVEEHKGIIGFE